MAVHVVAPGECLTSIAAHYGFSDYRKVYGHPSNQALRKKRPDPNLLEPGDQINIPDKTVKWESVSPGQHKSFVLKSKFKRKLKLTLLDDGGKPISGLPYTLIVGEIELKGKTDGDGVLEQEISPKAIEAALHIGGVVHQLNIGHMNPVRDAADGGVSGVQARLLNLGYNPGPVDGFLGSATVAAIVSFQRDHELEQTGAIDDKLITELEKTHGC